LVNYALKCALDILKFNKDGLKKIYKLLVAHKTITSEHLKENIRIKYDVIVKKLCDGE